ncbi:hypothetical protein [Burkholderia anthina]|uniref:hypothetical protein n=1 Tax=Burkholderia anthina TaxID=179879 RepID=UPI001AA09828|nr:hypothetical protein [Burkholderia anthina]QTD91751.1 hypothetical protein J4G50_26205 [Burkholderia anthina]
MALSFSCTTPQGFDAPNCYARIEDLRLASKSEIHFRLVHYKSAGNAISFKTDDGYMCAYDMDGDNPIKQAYEYLKTLPEFQGAIDVLETGQAA